MNLKISLVDGQKCTVKKKIVQVKNIWRYDSFFGDFQCHMELGKKK